LIDMALVPSEQINRREADDTWELLNRMGRLKDGSMKARNYSGITNAWLNEPCIVVGAGPSLRPIIDELGWEFLDGKHTIGINHTIEDYDRFEWFLFLDERFLEKTTYNLNNYKGRIYAQCNTKMDASEQVRLFHCVPKPTLKLEDGLYNHNFSGLAALNLAIISGANPIYLLGYGMGTNGNREDYHYKPDYTGNSDAASRFDKYVTVLGQFAPFQQFGKRIVHVTNATDIPTLTCKMKKADFIRLMRNDKPAAIDAENARVLHYSFTDEVARHADITRHVIQRSVGKHEMHSWSEPILPADLYILEHFMSTSGDVNNFPHKSKTIDIVHSSNCIPRPGFAKVVCLTNAWQKYLKSHGVDAEVIPGGIDLEPYKEITPTSEMVFGRITRWDSGKIHPDWNRLVGEILEELPEAKCLFYVKAYAKGRERLNHPRMIWDESCNIDMFKGDFLKNMSIYVHMNANTKETMSYGCVEALATGLPVVYLSEGTGVLEEVTGEAGIRCTSPAEVKAAILKLLKDVELRKSYCEKAKKQAQRFDSRVTVREFDRLIREVLGGKK